MVIDEDVMTYDQCDKNVYRGTLAKDSHTLSTSPAIMFIDDNVSALRSSSGYLTRQMAEAVLGRVVASRGPIKQTSL